ncbi:MFS transporter [Dyadobacter luticola]|uniref:MFS transporter n=1 Tax=Dyadobacter luticola TaxID=1979387 RepID=A0A5R9KXU2_9BACT|nr:MFS transporter [Dyadobacter luticola]TLV01094.1 MFS transporter [Dyadobacter luticola]
MRRSTRALLGISVALVTAATLHLTVGDRFHRSMWGQHGGYGCGQHSWKNHHRDAHSSHENAQERPVENSDNQ